MLKFTLLVALFATSHIVLAEIHTFEHNNVLGSSLTLTVDAESAHALRAETAALNAIQRLEKVYSRYDQHSELSRISSGKKLSKPASKDFITVVKLCQQWQQQLPMAFSCRLGEVKQAWQQAELLQTRPDRKAIRAIARRAMYSEYKLSQLKKGEAPSEFKWDFAAIAKGLIIDRALDEAKKAAPDAQAIGIDIGGDSRVWHSDNKAKPWLINIANPALLDDSQDNLIGQLNIHNGAIAYSGHNARPIKIGRRQYSHIVKPRDGWPKDFPNSAIVIAPTATEADALATALTTMAIGPALDWIKQRSNTEALLIDEQGRQYSSAGWHQRFSKSEQGPATATITFSLAKISSGNYRKPYVALWLENSEREVVKNFILLGDNERWMSKNSYWWRRLGRKQPELLQVFARPTRRAGEYQVAWQGRDDYGKPLAKGSYKLMIEAAREHGSHEKIIIEFELGKPLKKTEKGKQEIQFLTLETTSKPKI